jgi:hypothetical protein
MNEFGEESVIAALEWAHKAAAWADFSRSTNTISWDVPLVTCAITPPDCIHAELGSPDNAKHCMCVKHLNALQHFLADLLHVRPENSLTLPYKEELPDRRIYKQLVLNLSSEDRGILLRRLIAYTTYVLRNASSPDWVLSDCLEHVLDEPNMDEDAMTRALAPVENLLGKHIYHALDILRSVSVS